MFMCRSARGVTQLAVESFDPALNVGTNFTDGEGRHWSVWPFPFDSRIPALSPIFKLEMPRMAGFEQLELIRYSPRASRGAVRATSPTGMTKFLKCYGSQGEYQAAARGHHLWNGAFVYREAHCMDEHQMILLEGMPGHPLRRCLDEGHLSSEGIERTVDRQLLGVWAALERTRLTYVDLHSGNVLVHHLGEEVQVDLVDLDSVRAVPRK